MEQFYQRIKNLELSDNQYEFVHYISMLIALDLQAVALHRAHSIAQANRRIKLQQHASVLLSHLVSRGRKRLIK